MVHWRLRLSSEGVRGMHAVLMFLLAMAAGSLDLLDLTAAPLGGGLPPGWKLRPVRGQSAPEIGVRNDGQGPVLRVEGAGHAGWFYHELSQPIPETAGLLHWSWRVLEAPSGADLRVRETNDSPARVYVVFGKPGGLFGGSGRVIFYTFGNAEPDDYAGRSHVSSKLYEIRVDGATERGSWREHTVDPFADYRRIWRRNPPPITAIGLMQDTDQTRARAVAELRRLEWVTP